MLRLATVNKYNIPRTATVWMYYYQIILMAVCGNKK